MEPKNMTAEDLLDQVVEHLEGQKLKKPVIVGVLKRRPPVQIEKDQKIWTPDESAEEGYEPLLEGDEYNESVTLELTKPAMILEVETKELTIAPPTTAQMLEARAGKGTVTLRSLKYFAQCCNVPTDVIKNLHARDFTRIGLVIQNFTE